MGQRQWKSIYYNLLYFLIYLWTLSFLFFIHILFLRAFLPLRSPQGFFYGELMDSIFFVLCFFFAVWYFVYSWNYWFIEKSPKKHLYLFISPVHPKLLDWKPVKIFFLDGWQPFLVWGFICGKIDLWYNYWFRKLIYIKPVVKISENFFSDCHFIKIWYFSLVHILILD